MRHKLLRKNRFLGLIFFVIVMVAAIMAFSATRRVTLTTYYPAPYGKYNDLQSKTLTVSDKVGIGTTNVASLLTLGNTDSTISTDTSDGLDNKSLVLDGGGGGGYHRGAQIALYGNEYGVGNMQGMVLIRPGDVYTGGEAGSFQVRTAGDLIRLIVNYNGNVGIGTNNLYGGVHIKKSGQALNLQTENNSQTFDIQFYDADDASGNYKWDLTYRGNLIGDDLMLYRNAGTPVMTWQNSSGNVGIGTTSPGSRLQVGTPGMNGREYMQVDMESSAPPPGDCDSQPEGGRMIYDDLTKRLYICDGQDGWRYSNTAL